MKTQVKTPTHSTLKPTPMAFQARPFAVQNELALEQEHDASSLFERYLERRDFGSAGPQMVIQPALRQAQGALRLGPVADKYEQEADQVAKQVMRQIHAPMSQSAAQNVPHTTNNKVQRAPAIQSVPTSHGTTVDSGIERGISRARGGGQPLAEHVRAPMEQAFGADFSGVRVHTDAHSNRLNHSLEARAFTTGQDIFFRQAEYNPSSSGGQQLLAHELTHVVQQNGAVPKDLPIIQRYSIHKYDSTKKEVDDNRGMSYTALTIDELEDVVEAIKKGSFSKGPKDELIIGTQAIVSGRKESSDENHIQKRFEQFIEQLKTGGAGFNVKARAEADTEKDKPRTDFGVIDTSSVKEPIAPSKMKDFTDHTAGHLLEIKSKKGEVVSSVTHYVNKWKKGERRPTQAATMGSNAISHIAYNTAKNPPGRYEWLHLIASSLGGKNVVGNLVAGTYDANTQMIPFEGKAAELIQDLPKKKSPTEEVKIKATANLKDDTWIATDIDYEIEDKDGNIYSTRINALRQEVVTKSEYEYYEDELESPSKKKARPGGGSKFTITTPTKYKITNTI